MLQKLDPAIAGVGPWRYGEYINYFVDDAYITTSLRLYGEYSELEVDLWRRLIKPGDTVIDVGANIGALTVPLAHIVGKNGKVLAFEPQRQLCTVLKRNVNLDVVTVIEAALGSEPSEMHMPKLENLGHTNFGDISLASRDIIDEFPIVFVQQLDSYTLENVSFIKIDVQGHEAEVLRGAHETIETHKPVLYVESDQENKRAELINLLDELGYDMWWHQPPMFNPDNFSRCSLNIFGGIVSINMLCLPKGQQPPVELQRIEIPAISFTGGIVPKAIVKTKWAGIVRLGGLGDNLQAAALLKPLSEQGYLIDVITQEPGHCIFENNPFVTKLSVKKHERDLPQNDMNAWQAYFASRANEYDKFANLSHIVEGMLAFVQAQTGFWWPDNFRRKLANHSYIETMADCIGVPYDFGGHLFWPTDDEHADIERMYQKVSNGGERKVIGWCVTGTRIDKIHPYSPMIIARLIRELDASVVMFAAPPPYRDIETVKMIQEHVARQNGVAQWLFHAGGTGKNPDVPYQPPGQMIPGLPVDWPIRRTLTMAMHCDLIIGPDTGVPWAVAFEKIPKIMLLSHATPENIVKHWRNTIALHADSARVPCYSCHRLHDSAATCVQNKEGNAAACMTDISVELVLTAAKAGFGCQSSLDLMQGNWASNVTFQNFPANMGT